MYTTSWAELNLSKFNLSYLSLVELNLNWVNFSQVLLNLI